MGFLGSTPNSQISRHYHSKLTISDDGCLNREISVCRDMSLARKLSSETFSIKNGMNSFKYLLTNYGVISFPQTGGAKLADNIFKPIKYIYRI